MANERDITRGRPLILIIVFFVFAVLIGIGSYRSLAYWSVASHRTAAKPSLPWTRSSTHPFQKTPAMSDKKMIRPWMTFDYLNRLLHLPPMYLKETLQIRGLDYPNISIRRYAAAEGISSGMAIDRITNVVDAFTAP